MSPAIDIQNVSVSYRESLALKFVSLRVNQGELLAIAGPNGAGKTTLLSAINGLGRLRAGAVTILGMPMNTHRQTAIRKEIGYVPQVLNIDPRMPIKVEEVVMLGRFGRIGLFKKPSLKDKKIVDEVIDLTAIRNLAQRPIGHLSGGEQKKVALARALAQRPRILLLDEPLSNLDINAQGSILELIDIIHQRQNLTTVVVMHDLELLPKSCSRMVLLKRGRIIFDGSLNAALDEEVLSKLYDCRVKIAKNNIGLTIRAEEKIK